MRGHGNGAASTGARRAELGIVLVAAVLAFGTVGWQQWLHAGLLSHGEIGGTAAHWLRDGLLAVPLAMLAVWWGRRLARRGPASSPLAAPALAISLCFTLLLVPAVGLHGLVHELGEPGGAAAHAASVGAGAHDAQSGMRDLTLPAPQSETSIAEVAVHGVRDAALALPVALLLALAALSLLRLGRPGRREPAGRPSLLTVSVVVASFVVAGAIEPLAGGGTLSAEAAGGDREANALGAAGVKPFTLPLEFPPTLTGSQIEITMAQTEEQILPGQATRMWTYNSSFPGPIIRRPTGEPTTVTFTNSLPSTAGSTTVHHHGAHVEASEDGQPASFLIAPGGSRSYTYPAVEDGRAERAAPQWYHDHRDMVTGRNNWMGLVGAFIYEDNFERNLDLPEGAYDVPLLFADRDFNASNQIPYDFDFDGNTGDTVLVNGVSEPHFEVADRRYRVRLYNISNKREYKFSLSNGEKLTQIGTESGLLPAPVRRDSILLGPAERADVVIDFGGNLGERIVLQNGSGDGWGSYPGDTDRLMQFRVTDDVPQGSPLPNTLRPVPTLGQPVRTRRWEFDEPGFGQGGPRWTINGKGFNPNRVDARPVVDTTERWIFSNPTRSEHQVHVHLNDQVLISRNGRPPAPYERFKETWRLAPGEEVAVKVRFTDHTGRFVMHCHVLEHEDDAMMTQFQVVRP